ncbi:NAD kinase [Methylobacillus caricis]|uniref:NAD kinase n=1 Tax=Methylobacillus caricis TaxID=1971611 RepID=UPI001CFF8737|nr:NAD kinase [Methylobacillus caricis]MCB5186897.1 NAD kinase [Methylobacillus caricis]
MKSVFQTVALIGKYMNPETREQILTLARFLAERQVGIFIEEKTAEHSEIKGYTTLKLSAIGAYADLAIVLGGDGTMLTVARALVDYQIPLVGVNRGRFGFLTDINSDHMLESVAQILGGEFQTEQRILLEASILRDGKMTGQGYALNDVVVNKNGLARLIELEIYIDKHFVQKQRSDGLIVATPTGTTAYSLSAGGPILHPTLDAIALVPICPHTLSNRPIAINSASEVEIHVVHAEDASVHLDGQMKMALQPGDKVHVRRANNTITLLHPPGHNHYDVLREKLHWG